jgi:hypothetical protein
MKNRKSTSHFQSNFTFVPSGVASFEQFFFILSDKLLSRHDSYESSCYNSRRVREYQQKAIQRGEYFHNTFQKTHFVVMKLL